MFQWLRSIHAASHAFRSLCQGARVRARVRREASVDFANGRGFSEVCSSSLFYARSPKVSIMSPHTRLLGTRSLHARANGRHAASCLSPSYVDEIFAHWLQKRIGQFVLSR